MKLSLSKLPLILALYFTLVINISLSLELVKVIESTSAIHWGFVVSLPIFFVSTFYIIFQVFNWPGIAKPLYSLILMSSAVVSYAMFHYGVYVDYGMVENVFETNRNEIFSYVSWSSFLWVVLVGGVPTLALCFTELTVESKKNFALSKAEGMMISIMIVGAVASIFYKDYVSIGRNHPYLKKMIIPTAYVWYTTQYVNDTYFQTETPYKELGLDAHISEHDKSSDKPTLLVFVLGEAARVYNYQYFGYSKDTNRYTYPYQPVFFANVETCGTATAVSVPCMFSNMNRKDYVKDKAYHQDNVVDIMKRAGIYSLWYDNDGGDKGIAHNIDLITLEPKEGNKLCNKDHCYDVAMLDSFAQDTQNLQQNSVIFYHLAGSHGPTYYQRYPITHRYFVPDCQKADIENCTNEELVNTYDNTILYTDYFIATAIEKLNNLSDKYNVALLYLPDHGESLGEKGLYLHGVPYAFAPKEQTHVPMLFWMSNGFAQQKRLDENCLRVLGQKGSFSHDNLFDSILGLMGVETSEYRQDQDIFSKCKI